MLLTPKLKMVLNLKRYALFFTLLLGAVLLIIGWFLYNSKNPSQRTEKFVKQYLAVKDIHHQGKYDESIEGFKKVLYSAPDKPSEAKARYHLAFDLFVRNQGTDRVDAVRIYKEMIKDPDMPIHYKAAAMNEMAFLRDLSSDDGFFINNVLNEEPYLSFYKETGSVHGAMIKIYELSDSMYPTALAKFQIGLMLANGMVQGNPMVHGMTQEEAAKKIQQLIKEADPLINAVPYEQAKLAHMYMCRAMALGLSQRVLKNFDTPVVEEAYLKAISVADAGYDDFHSRGVALVTRFYYAVFLHTRFGAAREKDIVSLLKNFERAETIPEYKLFTEYLKEAKDRPADNFLKVKIFDLAKVSPEFRSYLLQIGWNL